MVKVSSAFLFVVGIVILLISVFGVVTNQFWLTMYVCVVGMMLVIISALTNMIGSETDVIDSDGKAVIVTGCDRGFGYEIARKFNSVGFKVFAGCLNPEENGGLQLREESGGRIYVFHLDVTSDESVDNSLNIVTRLLKHHALWCVINNAGIGEQSLSEFCPLASYQRHLDVNTLGPVRMCRAFLPLIRRSGGRIINMCSMASRVGHWCLSAYTTSKYALLGYSEVLRRETQQFGVKIITIEPSRFKTEIVNPDSAIELNKQYWREASDDLKAFYGEKFYKSTLKLYKKRHLAAVEDFSDVIDAVMDAAVSYSPRAHYACSSVMRRTLYWLMPLFPVWLVDMLLQSNGPTERVAVTEEG